MNKKEAAQLLTLVKLSYPASYRDMDDEWMKATINMWAMSFQDVPYSIMEQGFNHYRMNHKFPPTVAEMVEELRYIHNLAWQCVDIQRLLGNGPAVEHYKAIMAVTDRYRKYDVGAPNLGGLQGLLIGGGYDAAGASGDRMDREDRISLLDAGRG